MDRASLVNSLLSTDIAIGTEILNALNRANIKTSVALWAFLPEYQDWRLVLAGKEFDAAGAGENYGLVHQALNSAGFPVERTPTLRILRMDDPFIKTLRRIFGKTKSVEGMRLGGQTIGDRFLEDAYVYQIK